MPSPSFEDSGEQFKSAWNLSAQLMFQIGNLLQSASLNFRKGDFQQAFFDTEEIQTLIFSYINEEEEKELNNLGTYICKIDSYIKSVARNLNQENLKSYYKMKVLHNKKVKEYRKKVNQLLSKYNLLLVGREDASRMF